LSAATRPATPQTGPVLFSGIAMRARRLLFVAVVVFVPLTAAPVRTAVAQSGGGMIPTALAVAAAEPFSGLLGGHMQFVVDSAPDGWPKSIVLPAPARIVGGVGYADADIVLFDVPSAPERAMSSFASLLAAAGWRPGRPDARATPKNPGLRVFCADNAFLSVIPREAVRGRTTLEATHVSTRSGMFTPGCDSSDHTVRLAVQVGVSNSTPDSSVAIPARLVTALLSGATPSGGAPITYAVGKYPEGWPAELVPSGASPVGGMTKDGTLVAVFADTTAHSLATFYSLVQRAGYARPVMPHSHGFISSGGPYSYFCRDSATVSAASAPAPAGVSYLRVTYVTNNRVGCTIHQFAPLGSPDALELPELASPPGMRGVGARSGGSANQVTNSTLLNGGSLSAAEVLAHYERQLVAAGWTSAPATSTADAAAQLFRAHDKMGHGWHGVLTVFATKAGRDVSLAMQREDDR
jgi:hypothetical protein